MLAIGSIDNRRGSPAFYNWHNSVLCHAIRRAMTRRLNIGAASWYCRREVVSPSIISRHLNICSHDGVTCIIASNLLAKNNKNLYVHCGISAWRRAHCGIVVSTLRGERRRRLCRLPACNSARLIACPHRVSPSPTASRQLRSNGKRKEACNEQKDRNIRYFKTFFIHVIRKKLWRGNRKCNARGQRQSLVRPEINVAAARARRSCRQSTE